MFPADQATLSPMSAQVTERSAWRFVSLGLLIVVSVVAWLTYAWVSWPQHWQSRLMHLVLFMPWTIAWHATVCCWVPREKLFRAWVLVGVPVLAASGGEAIQCVWKAAGHDPEWRGLSFSVLGVGLGWLVLGLWSLRTNATEPLAPKDISS